MTTTYTHFLDLAKEVQPPDKGILSRTLFSGDRLKVVVFGFARGEELSEHAASMPAALHFPQGEADAGRRHAGTRAGNLGPHADRPALSASCDAGPRREALPKRLEPILIQRHRGCSARSSIAFGLDDDSSDVVLKGVPGEVAHGVEEGGEDFIGRFVLVRPNDTKRALQAELLPIR
jgi:hypothetical protein